MKKESLEVALDEIFKALDKADIDLIDKLELLTNLRTLLQYENYEHDIQVLKEKQKVR